MVRARTYDEVVAALRSAMSFGIHPSLTGIRALAEALDHPECAYESVQVTGTNGKTSVTRATAAILTAQGMRTGAYTSPHLESYTERIALDVAPIDEAGFTRALALALEAADELASVSAETLGLGRGVTQPAFTEFELLTAGALVAFREAAIDWAVLEVGMGGRWDATSVVDPRVAVVTGVSLDHTDRLGSTREAIAADKAYIIKPGSIAVIGPGCAGVEHVFIERALAVGAPLVHVGRGEDDVAWHVVEEPRTIGQPLRLSVDGVHARYGDLVVCAPAYQAPNVATAIAAAESALGGPLDAARLRTALANLTFPGRFEIVSRDPLIIVDGAHNPEAASVLAHTMEEELGGIAPVIVLGVMADKDVEGVVHALVGHAAGFVCTQSRSSRALAAPDLALTVQRLGGPVLGVETTVRDAVACALGSAPEAVVCTGSIYVAGEARTALGHGGQRTHAG